MLHEGDDVWLRVCGYFPEGFDFSTDSGHLKFLRIHTRSAEGSNEGYFDVLISGDLSVSSELGTGHYANNPDWKDNGDVVPTGIWQSYEMQVHFSATPGQGAYRVWQNGSLVFEDLQTATLRSDTSEADSVFIFTYWNGNAPVSQNAYVDEIVVTSATPSQTDDAGNPFVGVP